jgi:hypothetical protein
MSARLPVAVAPAPHEEEGRDLSAEAIIERELVSLAAWLAVQPQEGQRDGFHWRSGYAAGLKRALAMLSSRGMTLH